MHRLQLQFIKALGHPRRALHPARKRLAVEMEAQARQNLRLTIERRCQAYFAAATWAISAVVAMPPSTSRAGACAWTIGPRRRGRHIGTDRAQHPQSRRSPVERLADVFADPVHLAGATRAQRRGWLDHLLAARQMRRQRADVAPGFRALASPAASLAWPSSFAGGGATPVAVPNPAPAARRNDRRALRTRRRRSAPSASHLLTEAVVLAVERERRSRPARQDRKGDFRGESP